MEGELGVLSRGWGFLGFRMVVWRAEFDELRMVER